jgi:ATP-dependent RNA helicase HelY
LVYNTKEKGNIVPGFKHKYKRNFHSRKRTQPRDREVPKIKPSIDPRLRSVFSRIGVPENKAFTPDPFQLEALSAITKSDCLVSAPTGSGKTWIAVEAIERIHKAGGRSWYASPLKALSNSKYVEFGERFGRANVGIVTGDRVENPDAPITVGTTEILRNQLYDAMYRGEDLASDLVILDEAHFLGDEERGVVWEETIIYLPVRIPLLLLSATIGNSHQIAGWIRQVRGKTCTVIEERGRPVPLFPLFFNPTGRLIPLLGRNGPDKKVLDYLHNPKSPSIVRARRLPPFGEILGVLRRYNLLPAIFFLKSRSDCDNALDLCTNDEGHRRRPRLNSRIDELIRQYPRLERHAQLRHLRNSGVASHHSGQLPLWKMAVEDLMAGGLLDAVFATSTVAAGINVPARSIVFLNSDRYNGSKFLPLTATELHQMTGRAGRRGMDNIGFAVAVPGPYMDVPLVATLLRSQPEDVVSQIKVDFSMVLNLLLSHDLDQIKDLLFRSFASYQNQERLEKDLDDKLSKAGKALMEQLPHSLCGSPESVLSLSRKMAAMRKDLHALADEIERVENNQSKLYNLVPGRLFLDTRSRPYCVVKIHTRRDTTGVLACRVTYRARKKKPPNIRFFTPEKVLVLLDKIVAIPPAEDHMAIQACLSEALPGEMPPPLESLPLGEEGAAKIQPLKDRILFLEGERDRLICSRCSHFNLCHGRGNKPFRRALQDFSRLWDAANAVKEEIWADFMQHLSFLKLEGYVNPDDTLTGDGIWASQLRLDQPLMIAEALRLGLFPDSDPALLAALVATFVYDKDIEVEFDHTKVPKELIAVFTAMKQGLFPFTDRKTVHGFPVKPIPLWVAATIYAWARGLDWEHVVRIGGMNEGHLAMLISRTADNLRQMVSLTRVYPAVARTANDAIPCIMREPVFFD